MLFKLNREKHFLGSIYNPTDAGKVKRAPLFFSNDEFYWNPNKSDLEYRVRCPVNEWIKNGEITFIWHQGLHYEAFSSPKDVTYYSARKHEQCKTCEDAASM